MLARVVALALLASASCKFPDLPPLDDGDGGPDANLNSPQPLSVAVTGEGTVSSDPPGISCPGTCMASFDPLSTVTLTATAATSSVFEGWTGDCIGSDPCSLTMNGAKTVNARFALHGAVKWVDHISFSGDDFMEGLAVDGAGNVIVAGTVDDGGGFDIYVQKLASSDGQPIWTQHLDTPDPAGNEQFEGLALDSAGNIYVAVALQGNGSAVTYAPGKSAVGDLFFNIVVLRLAASDGSVEWVKQWGGSSQDRPSGIAISGTDLYVVGNTSSNPSTFDTRTIAGQTGYGFIARANTDTGAIADVKLLAGSVDLNAVVANGNNVLVAGATRTAMTVNAGCGVTPSGAGSDAMVLAYTGSTLTCVWGRNFGDSVSNNDAFVTFAASYANGDWGIVGHFEGTLSGLTPSALVSRGLFDIFAARLAGDGTHKWSFRYGDTPTEFAGGIATTPGENTLFAGVFEGPSLTVGPTTIDGTNNAFVTRMSSSPTTPIHEWAVSLGGTDQDAPEAVAVGPDGSVYVLSRFSGMTTVGSTPLAAQQQDAWIAALVR